jgi:chromatin segregation and condensation protein Rec8/ScpA/Scc1 (kleisin family)
MTEEAKIVSGNDALAPPSPQAVAGSSPTKATRDTTKKQESDSPFAVAVTDVYEGPLDLLLDLIRKQDIDIYDIPIAKITSQYLAYVEKIRELDVNVAAEFIYMAAVLIHIKSKMLLPRDPDAPAEEQEDPRNELVNRLLEHEKFKSAAQMLLQKQQIEDAVLSNPSLKEFMEAEGTEPEIAADVIDLVKTFQQVLERLRTRPVLNGHGGADDRLPPAPALARRSSHPAQANSDAGSIAPCPGLHVPGAAGNGSVAGDSSTAGANVRRDRNPQALALR